MQHHAFFDSIVYGDTHHHGSATATTTPSADARAGLALSGCRDIATASITAAPATTATNCHLQPLSPARDVNTHGGIAAGQHVSLSNFTSVPIETVGTNAASNRLLHTTQQS